MTYSLGIRREDKNSWETRTPLTPADAMMLSKATKMRVVTQPSKNRTYPDDDYTYAGIEIDEEIWNSDLVIAIKEIPIKLFHKNAAYLFFSHTIKGQPYNMPMLKRLCELGCTLLDYELITDDDNRRLIFFSSFAGYAGMIDSLHALGQRLKVEGIASPFLNVKMMHQNACLEKARLELQVVGRAISENGLDKSLCPFVIGFTGNGQVSSGAQDIARLLPHEYLRPDELAPLFASGKDLRNRIFLTVFEEKDMFVPIESNTKFNLSRYYEHPEEFQPVFENYLKYLTICINGIFWTEKYPRIVTKKGLKSILEDSGNARIRVLGDISCDIDGSFETTYKSTDPANPCYTWNPLTDKFKDGYHDTGIVSMAVDNLPCELSRESSDHFSKMLLPLLSQIKDTDWRASREQLKLPKELERALIVYHGKLEPAFKHLEKNLSGPPLLTSTRE